MSAHNSEKAARKLASLNWEAIRQRHDDPVDFIVFFLDCALAAVGDAALDASIRDEQRAAAGYALSHAIRSAARVAEKATEQKHDSLPDLGLQQAIADAVDALHRIASKNPKTLQNLSWFQRWPVNLAADGKPVETCVLLHQLAGPALGSRATGFTLNPKAKRPPSLGGRWNAIALEMRTQIGVGQTPLRPPRSRAKNKWPEWEAIEQHLENTRESILGRPEIRRWKTGTRLSKLKDGAVWAELKNEVKRALLTLAKNNDLKAVPSG